MRQYRGQIRLELLTAVGATLLAVPLGCRQDADRAPGDDDAPAQGGFSSRDSGGAAGALPEHVVRTDSGAVVVEEHTTSSYDEYAPSCEEQQCTSDERCVAGPQGTYCVHPCPGQPCPTGSGESYCTREGGVICIEE